MQQGGEPSLEDILASIKKVMTREEASAAGVDAEGAEPADADEADDVLDMAEAERPGASLSSAADLPSPEAANAIRDSLAALERVSRSGSTGQVRSSADASLEALTRAMLRPMITEWLDANLPEIVERVVQGEIVRIVERHR